MANLEASVANGEVSTDDEVVSLAFLFENINVDETIKVTKVDINGNFDNNESSTQIIYNKNGVEKRFFM